ncbi:MAG: sigma 54-dependent Fis family transcriptional regulator [Archangiaceae bacterium]|nr:sigma 54-dependent Fis family transcriptional regulator [Archangiaceae bacterium]
MGPTRSSHTLTLTHHPQQHVLDVPVLEVQATSPDGARCSTPLGLRAVTIGSGAGCDLVLNDPAVSRVHCQLALTEHGIELTDLGSKNGVFVGAAQVLQARVLPGAVITLGGSQLSVNGKSQWAQVPLFPAGEWAGAIGPSLVMRALFAQLESLARQTGPVLIRGESGTGKDLLARGLHERGPNRAGPFVVFDCASVSPDLFEAQLFGYEAGAFTGAAGEKDGLFQEAEGGTLLLDEVAALPDSLQVRLLRALDTSEVRRLGASAYRKVKTRVVATSRLDPRGADPVSGLRRDLYHRLAGWDVTVPPLRERLDDLPALVEHLLARQSPPSPKKNLPPHWSSLLASHHWPGNVRELKNLLLRLTLFPEAAPQLEESLASPFSPLASFEGMTLSDARAKVVDDFEQAFLRARLRAHQGKVSAFAESLGVGRQFAYKLIARFGLTTDDD